MKFGIGSDVHGNWFALEAVIADMEKAEIEHDRIILQGDTLGYNADSEKCARNLSDTKIKVLMGNHDVAVLKKRGRAPANPLQAAAMERVNNFNPYAQAVVNYVSASASDECIDYIAKMPFMQRFNHSVGVHEGLYDHSNYSFYFASEENPIVFGEQLNLTFEALENLSLPGHRLRRCFIGHSHTPGLMVQGSIVFMPGRDKDTVYLGEDQAIVDVGSIGQPRDGDPRASWVEYDDEKETVTFRRVEYDIDATIARNNKIGIPEKLSDRLKIGW